MNPLANESGIIRKGSSKKSKEEIDEMISNGYIHTHLIGMNDCLTVCAKACGCCWDKPVPTEYNKIASYVSKRSMTGHTSILEHSNFVAYLYIPESYTDSFVEFLGWVKYLNTTVAKADDGKSWHFIIGGSLRGYADLYRESTDIQNPILKAISGLLYTYSDSAAFEDICELGLLDKTLFANVEPDSNFMLLNSLNETYESELFDVLGLDSITTLYTNLYFVSQEAAAKIDKFDLIKFCTITVLFKNMSRTCTHQLVRHRNAITQESQRYVDYSNACFNSPDIFKPEKYDKDHKYKISFAGAEKEFTLAELGEEMCKIYEQLYNPEVAGEEYHLLREDARAYLPSNVQCKKIYMTYTIKTFLKFLYLREDKHAQAEIRKYATAIGDWFRSVEPNFPDKDTCDVYTKPRLTIGNMPFPEVDEDIPDETKLEITEEDYLRTIPEDEEN